MAPTALWPFNKCPTAVLMATVVITNSHNVVVAVSFETATNPVHISSCILYVFLLCTYIAYMIFPWQVLVKYYAQVFSTGNFLYSLTTYFVN